MKEQFGKVPRFNQKSREIIALAEQICNSYAEQKYDLSLRQLYYQFISRDYFENSEKNYKGLGETINNARLAGLIDWDTIKDRGRVTISNNHWDSPAQILDAAAAQYRLDTWEDQENYIEVMVEKQALEGVLLPVCSELDIRFTANKGYSSSSALYETGQRLAEYADSGKCLHIVYMGDHDPSGIDMTRDVRERLSLFSRRPVTVHRIALTIDQIKEHNPPPNPAKMTDSRAPDYIKEYGTTSSWELDALEPSLLADLVRRIVKNLRDEALYQKALERQEAMRDELSDMSEKYRNGEL